MQQHEQSQHEMIKPTEDGPVVGVDKITPIVPSEAHRAPIKLTEHQPRLTADQIRQYLEDNPEQWRRFGACVGHLTDFYPPGGPERKEEKEAREARALAICDACRVRTICFEYAIAHREEHGVWGGTTENERKLIFKHRRRP